MIFFSVLVFLNLWFSSLGTIQWFATPQDVHVDVGETAVFPCNFTGSSRVPYWNINDRLYYFNEVPSRHFYSNRALHVLNVNISDNLTRYQCEIYLTGWIRSTTGTLYVIKSVPPSTEATASMLIEDRNSTVSSIPVTTKPGIDPTTRHNMSTTTRAIVSPTVKPSIPLATEHSVSLFTSHRNHATVLNEPFPRSSAAYPYPTSSAPITSKISCTTSLNAGDNLLAYGIIFSAIILSTTIFCTVSIIVIAVLIYKCKTHPAGYPNRGYPNPAHLTDAGIKHDDPSWFKTNEAYDMGTIEKLDRMYDEINL